VNPNQAPGAVRPLGEIAALFLRLGILGFGGPPAHIALMEGEVVRRGWLDRQHFLDALAATNLIPGPNSTEMAIHLGYLRGGRLGGLVAGLTFIAPAFALMLALSWAYFELRGVPQVGAVLAGLKPAALAIIVVTAGRLARTAVTDLPRLAFFGLGLVATIWLPAWQVLALLVAGLAGYWRYRPRGAGGGGVATLLAVSAPAAPAGTLLPLALVFLKAGALLFGGGYVLIPLVQAEVVDGYGWLSRQAFLDGIALGQSTPGPIVITATFVGYAAAGWAGAVVATVAVFAPAFAYVLFGTGPFLDRLRARADARAFLSGVNAAVAGAIVAAGLLLAPAALESPLAWLLFGLALLALLRTRLSSVWVLVAAAALALGAQALSRSG
jgi:chromate transporter